MAQDRSRDARRDRGSRQREDYGWGVPIRGMYNYSLDYGSLGGPETDSESIPGYDTEPADWTGPRPSYEQRHWAAREPTYGIGAPRLGPGPWRRGEGDPSRRERFSGGEWRQGAGRGEGGRRQAMDIERGSARRSAGDWRRGGSGWSASERQQPYRSEYERPGPPRPGPERGGDPRWRWPEWPRGGFREELGGMTPAHRTDPYWRRSGYGHEYESRRADGYGSDYRRPERLRHERPLEDRGRTGRGRPWYGAEYGQRTLQRWEDEWERGRGRGAPDFDAYDREFGRARPFRGPRGWSRPRSG